MCGFVYLVLILLLLGLCFGLSHDICTYVDSDEQRASLRALAPSAVAESARCKHVARQIRALGKCSTIVSNGGEALQKDAREAVSAAQWQKWSQWVQQVSG